MKRNQIKFYEGKGVFATCKDWLVKHKSNLKPDEIKINRVIDYHYKSKVYWTNLKDNKKCITILWDIDYMEYWYYG